MKSTAVEKLKKQIPFSVLTILLGVLLLVYMILVEDEPGGLPLLLIVVGTIWFFVTRFRIRSQNKLNEQITHQ